MRTILGTTLLLSLTTGLEAQRGSSIPPLTPPSASVFATPLTVTVAWKPVDGAGYYTVEWASSATGPWSLMPLDPKGGTQVTASTAAGTSYGGALYYYRISALAPLGPRGEQSLTGPGVTVVPRVTPQLNSPLGVEARQEGADLRVSWAPVPYATGYRVTAAVGYLLPSTHTVEVGAQYAEARLLNVALPTVPSKVWVAVYARYGTVGALSNAIPMQFSLAPVQFCWPPSSVPGPTPNVTITPVGPTTLSFATTNSVIGQGLTRVERMGSQGWQGVGCGNLSGVHDQSLTPATQYQYRVTEIIAAAVGQTIVSATTPPAPDSPPVTATIGGCTANGCPVSLNWNHAAGAHDYRIESSYGLYRAMTGQISGGEPAGVPLSVQLGTVPAGVHTFFVTPLLSWQRPSPKPPAQVTVTVP